tara:strand:+ start:2735 stop:2920 length:186 start_codon:yes stop_codon:yes gene_type:complete
MKSTRLPYPTQAQIQRVVKAARKSGVDVAGFRIEADGGIVVFDRTASPKDEFSAWQETRSN